MKLFRKFIALILSAILIVTPPISLSVPASATGFDTVTYNNSTNSITVTLNPSGSDVIYWFVTYTVDGVDYDDHILGGHASKIEGTYTLKNCSRGSTYIFLYTQPPTLVMRV